MAYVLARGDRFTGYYRDRNGQRYSAGTFETYDEALHRARGAESSGNPGNYRLTMTLREYVSKWLPESELLPLTQKGYAAILEKHVLPTLGSKKVGEITRLNIRDLMRRLAHNGVSASTRAHAKAALSSAFKELIEADLLDVNPAHKIRVKQAPKPYRSVLEPGEFKKIRKELPSSGAKLFAQFLVVSGCRFGEASELRVRDIDFGNGDVYVERRVVDLGAKYNEGGRFMVISGTKGGSGRLVRVTPEMAQQLQKHVKKNGLKDSDLIFAKELVMRKPKSKAEVAASHPAATGHGTRYFYTRLHCRCDDCRRANAEYQKAHRKLRSESKARPAVNVTHHLPRDTWRRMWTKAVERSGVRWSPRTHDLRHANATLLLKNGVDLHEVKERLGHSSISTTEGYLHRLKSRSDAAANAVGEFL